MADEKQMKQARAVFETLCRTLDEKEWHYEKFEEELKIECTAQGEDLPMELAIHVRPEIMIVTLLSHLPFIIPEDKRIELAVAVSIANYKLVQGCFDYDFTDGHMFFRMSSSFRESLIGSDMLLFMVLCSCKTIDDFNEKFLMLGKGMITLDQYSESIKKL